MRRRTLTVSPLLLVAAAIAGVCAGCANSGDRQGPGSSGSVSQPGGTNPGGTNPGDTNPPPGSADSGSCRISGCSSQLSAAESLASTCEWREAYGCYRGEPCETQANGQCGWTLTASMASCLVAAGETCGGFA